MISSLHRFKGHTSLRFVYSGGKTYRNQNFAIKTALNQKRQTYRLAVVVSKKVSKLAVIRNKIRRRIYEAVRLLEDDITQPHDIVVMVFNESVATMPTQELKSSLNKLLIEASIINKKANLQD
jgi:ribonuclease P protein component